ncbi:hypothetical protein WME99_06665 [Sorangium sp. So ce136]|uniref:hypothetical protein n=1 Tax=Sorangium sp. So ce136 TaxID=3133284 RepID=UPI003F0FC4A6
MEVALKDVLAPNLEHEDETERVLNEFLVSYKKYLAHGGGSVEIEASTQREHDETRARITSQGIAVLATRCASLVVALRRKKFVVPIAMSKLASPQRISGNATVAWMLTQYGGHKPYDPTGADLLNLLNELSESLLNRIRVEAARSNT